MSDPTDKETPSARKALEAWIKNYRLWCHDQKQTGWQDREE